MNRDVQRYDIRVCLRGSPDLFAAIWLASRRCRSVVAAIRTTLAICTRTVGIEALPQRFVTFLSGTNRIFPPIDGLAGKSIPDARGCIYGGQKPQDIRSARMISVGRFCAGSFRVAFGEMHCQTITPHQDRHRRVNRRQCPGAIQRRPLVPAFYQKMQMPR